MPTIYFNTTLGISMIPDGEMTVRTVSPEQAAEDLRGDEVENVANPGHANTLDAVSRRLGVDVRAAKGGRVRLEAGDSCLVAEISGVPRGTREFTAAAPAGA